MNDVARPEGPEQRSDFWEGVHATRPVDGVSWWQATPQPSLDVVRSLAAPGQAILDVGAGSSTLADHLVADGYDVTALDLSASALARVRDRLAASADEGLLRRLHPVVDDVLTWRPTGSYAVWHDRAVFHFLTAPEERAAYLRTLAAALAPGGAVVVATFGPDGPTACSGLPVVRYDVEALVAALAPGLPGASVVEARTVEHTTPWESPQQFTLVALRSAAPVG